MMQSVDPSTFQQFVRRYPHSQFEVREPSHWLDAQKVRHRYVLDAYLEFRPTLGTEEPALLDIGAYPGSLVKTLRNFVGERGRIDGAGLISKTEFTDDLQRYNIGYHPCNFDPLIGFYTPPERPAPERVQVPDETYDGIFATEIIEHTLDPFYLLREALRLLKPGGLLVLTTPNQATLSQRLRLLAGRSIYYHLKESIMYAQTDWRPHIREYTQAEMAQLLRDAGYTIEKATFMDLTDDDPRIWNWRHPVLRFAKELSRLAMRVPSLRHNLLFVGRKPPR